MTEPHVTEAMLVDMRRAAERGCQPIEMLLRSLLKGEHSSLTLSFNAASGPNYSTVREMDETDGLGEWVSDEERGRAYDLNSEWVLQWYPDTPTGFHAIRASSLPALIAALTKRGG